MCEVNRRAAPPSREAIHRSPPYANTTLSLEISPNLKSFVGPEGTSSAVCAGAFAGAVVIHSAAAKPRHNTAFLPRGMGFIASLPDNWSLLRTPGHFNGRAIAQKVSLNLRTPRRSIHSPAHYCSRGIISLDSRVRHRKTASPLLHPSFTHFI